MSALAAQASFLSSESSPHSPSKPSSPTTNSSSPYSTYYTPRSLMNLNSNADLRAQYHGSPVPNASQQQNVLEPPEGVAFAEYLRTWNHSHVSRWLVDMKCGAHAEAFRTHEILGDLLLELDQDALREMSITSIGDRIRILNGVRILRQRTASRMAPSRLGESLSRSSLDVSAAKLEDSGSGRVLSRKEHGRPPPLHLQPNANKGDLPDIIRDTTPDSATARTTALPPIRPLPQPNQTVVVPPNLQNGAPSGSLSTPGGSHRSHLPPLPPPPKGQPPPLPSHATRPATTPRPWANSSSEAPAYTSQPLPPTPHNQSQLSTPTSWSKQPSRSTSPLPPPPPRVRGPVNKNGLGATSPPSGKLGVSRLGNHPYANAQPTTLHPPAHQGHNLSPIEEAFSAYHSTPGTPSPPSQGYPSTRGPYSQGPSLDDIKKKIVKFVIPEEGTSFTIDVTNCSRGQEVIEKVLKKIGKTTLRNPGTESPSEEHFNVDGWGVWQDSNDEGIVDLACGILRRRSRIPPSPTAAASDETLNSAWPKAKRPSKLRNFFGQRPPSELITDHLPEYFPMAEKKVLRTARHSMLMRHGTSKRQSIASSFQQPPASRFSTSTQGSQSRRSISPSRASLSSLPPPPPEKYDGEPIPRMSLSTEDGRSRDLSDDDVGGGPSNPPAPQLLPPIPTGDFSDSMGEFTGNTRPVSRAMSINSKRLSYLSELRSNRDVSDTASLMTVDEITAEVESRRVSKVPEMTNPDLDDWTKVENEDEDVVVEADDDDETVGDDVEGTTLNADEDDQDEDEESDDEFDIAIPVRTANKWIKGALIGAGSFGKVYLGMDASNGLLMAVKQVELPVGSGPNQERKKSMLSALETEIELLKNLQHPNIVRYLYSSLDEEFLNIFLEYVPGGSVATLLSNYGAFEENLVRNFVRQILQGLDYLHERDIIHRDIKGANILVDNKGGVKISDFGISKKVDDNLLGGNRLHRPSLQGSVFWMAPEVVKQTGHTKKADIWSVGCLVVEMLTGEHPWAQLTQMQAIFKIGSSAKPAIPSDISAEAQDFLQRTFEINHEARPGAAELLQHPWIAKKSKKSKEKDSSPATDSIPSS
ncbi:hypothetical protein H1R20_g5738, partial [Candolleomyces eurysporus]